MTQRAIDGNYIYFVTTNVHQGRWFFYTTEKAARLGQAIQACCRMKHFDLLAYCILLNHLHFLVRKLGIDEINNISSAFGAHRTLESARCGEDKKPLSSHLRQATNIFLFPHRRLSSRRPLQAGGRFTLGDLMKSIKGSFSRTLPKGKFWQHRSNFRIVGSEEYLENVIEYIRYNYRKMNLSESYGQAPFVFIDQSAIDRVFNECGSCERCGCEEFPCAYSLMVVTEKFVKFSMIQRVAAHHRHPKLCQHEHVFLVDDQKHGEENL